MCHDVDNFWMMQIKKSYMKRIIQCNYLLDIFVKN